MIKKVLIVDDNSTNLYMLETLLKGYGFEVISAENGKDALDKARLNPPDLIVTDILMPVMDGYALCRQWKSDDKLKHIPLVFYTATYTEPKDEKFALSLGADRFILKPQEADILMNMLKEVLGEKYTARQVVTKPLGEEMEFFRQYNEILFKKLEKKILDLEIANQKLRILEEKYRLSFEHVMDVVYTIDTDLNVLTISPSVERILGYKPQEFMGRPITDLGYILTPESFEQAITDISLILKGETISATVYQFIAKDGTIKCGEVSGSPIMHEGKIVSMISVARDITDRKLTEEALRESEKKYRDLFDFLPIPVYEMDFEANIISANRAIYETFRGTEEDLKKGFKGWQLLSPEDVAKSAKNIERLLKGQQIEGTEYTLMRLDGSFFPAIVISSVIYSDGKPVGLRGAIIDITERKQQENELHRTNIFLNSIVENIPDMIFLKDSNELRFIRFNRAGEDLLGYSREELLGKGDYDFFPKEQADLFTKKDREVMRGKEVVDIAEESIQTRNKGERILHTKKVPILNANGEPEYLLGISEDITERKKVDEELKESENKYRLLADNVQDVIFVLDMNLKYTYISPSVKNMRGYEPEEVLKQQSIEQVLTPSSIDLAMKTLSDVMELEKIKHQDITESRTLQLEMRRKDGTTLWTEVKFSFIRDEDQQPVGIMGLTRDITERKQADKKLEETLKRLRKSFGATIQVMVSAVEMRDPYTAGHQISVANLARAIATEMGLPLEKIDGICMAGSIHDIGKLSIPAEILSKPTKLTNIEFSLIKEHPRSGYEMLKDVESPWPLAEIVYQHHERMDGKGYPRNLKGDEIIIEARIIAVADVVEAMASHRPYRAALGIKIALEEIEKNKGIIYDNDVADACLKLFREKGYQLTKNGETNPVEET